MNKFDTDILNIKGPKQDKGTNWTHYNIQDADLWYINSTV